MRSTDVASHSCRIVMAVANNSYPHDVRVRREAESLRRAGHRVTVIAPASEGQARRETVGGVDVRRYPPPPEARGIVTYAVEFVHGALAAFALVLWTWWRDGLDVLHVHNPPDTLFVAGLLPKLFGKRLVFDHHDLAPELYAAKFGDGASEAVVRALRTLERFSCRAADRVVTVNRSYRGVDIARNGVAADRIVVVRNGPPLEHLESPAPAPETRAGASFVIGYLGNMSAQDGVDHLIRALHHLDADIGFRDWRAIVVGPADDPHGLRRLAEELAVADRIDFVGYQPEAAWRSMLAATDACSVPDPPNPLNEKSTMIKTMEYMALGKPVVAYDMVENRASAGDAALYAEPGDPADMARCLGQLVDDPEHRARMGAVGRRRIRDELAWEYSEDRLVRMYRDLAHDVRGGDRRRRSAGRE